MGLAIATDHADAYTWAAVALAHLALGLALIAVAAAAGLRRAWALAAVVAGYLLAWEIGVQRLGAGWADALTDTAMVAARPAGQGRRARQPLAAVLIGVALAIWHGIKRRD
jgi:hypothetical protein